MLLKLFVILVFLSSHATTQMQDADPSPQDVERMMSDVLSAEYTVPMMDDSTTDVDWMTVGKDFNDHMNKLRRYSHAIDEGKSHEEAATIADINLGLTGSKRHGKYVCYWVAKKFASTCGPRDGVGKYLGFTDAKFTLRKYAVIKKGRKRVSFNPACRGHDLCWTRCERSRKQCDKEFHNDFSKVCDSKLSGKMKRCRKACRSIRDMMYTIVRKFGKSFFCNSIKGRTRKYFLMKKKVKGSKLREQCVELVGTFGGLIRGNPDVLSLAKLMERKKVDRAYVDRDSCRYVTCHGSGSCAYLERRNGKGKIVRSNSCSKKRMPFCDVLMRNGKSPNAQSNIDDVTEGVNFVVENNIDRKQWDWMVVVVGGFVFVVSVLVSVYLACLTKCGWKSDEVEERYAPLMAHVQ